MASLSFRGITFCDPLRQRGPALDLQPVPRPLLPFDAAEGEDSEQASLDRAWLRSVFRRAGLPMEAYKPESLQRRKTACLRALGANSVMQARLLLARWPDRLPTVLSALLIGVTDFFRDPQVFEALAGLLRQGGRPMRVWSAGCSNGAELYSVAMLLEQAGLLEGSQLIGTDCRPDAIAQAVAGRYDPAAATGIPADLLCRYGQFEEGSFRISNRLRQAVKFRTGNLLAGIEPGGWDMILCRNMAIYLQPEVVGKLWIALQGALSPGGLLMLGRAERPMGTTRLRPAGPMLWRRSEGM